MKHIQNEQLFISENALTTSLFQEDYIFFDIETTGFSPTNSSIYLVGCLRRKNDKLIIDQFFAENKDDEVLVLKEFMYLLNQHSTIISFNGIGFDIPFIKAKCKTHRIPEKLHSFSYIDIYKLVSSTKFLLKLPNYKQKTIEAFLGLEREDKYSGGELINVYDDYMKNQSEEAEKLLLLHNYEDVTGMVDLLPILSYNHILNGAYTIDSVEIAPFTSYDGENGTEMIITLTNDYTAPKRVSFHYKDFYFTINKNETKLRIGVYEGELKYFYENFKDYYYLPEEDMAIHESVATFVDKDYREKAKASNCYTRKSGQFLPQCASIMAPVFKENYKDKITYFELTEEFIKSDIMIRRYVEHIFAYANRK